MSFNEPMGWPAFILILLILRAAFFGGKGERRRRGYTRSAPQPDPGTPRPCPPGTPQSKREVET